MRFRLAIAPILLFAAQASQAGIITFDSSEDIGIIDSTMVIEGYAFTSQHYHINTPDSGSAWNGTTFIGEEGGGRGLAVTMSLATGGAFSLLGFDAGEFLPGFGLDSDFPNATYIDVNGWLFGGGFVTQRLTLDGIADGRFGLDDFESFLLDDRFSNLSSVTFQGWALDWREGGLALDNINVVEATNVSEPGTLSIMALGLLGIGIVRRRKLRSGS